MQLGVNLSLRGMFAQASRSREIKRPWRDSTDYGYDRGIDMSKGMDSKKNEKKKPAKTMKEKKAAKQEKKRNMK